MPKRSDLDILRDALGDLRRVIYTAQHMASQGRPLQKARITFEARKALDAVRPFSRDCTEDCLSTDALCTAVDAILEASALSACSKAHRVERCGRAIQALSK